uniref:Cytochrome c biogenesis protein CcsA n=1 Tax=Rhipiliopsis peltata TaxID=2320810 RepID=A0A386B170_9CHLO|nr:cytochrome c biogenesis protein ccs1 [Rhipiliopsis peltata]AYC65446.1 cytochrome c biogenesis protein ccs1 [Rhipiliopsis peltata]
MENFLNNCSFLFLLCSMTFYWIRAFLNLSIFSFFGKLTIISANLTMFFLLIYRGIRENHFPLSNHGTILFYEALIFLSWSLTLITILHFLFLIKLTNFIELGAITTPPALFLNAFASFQLPESFKQLSPLIPALQSNWLMMHVTVMLLSYATLISGCVLSIAFMSIFAYMNIFSDISVLRPSKAIQTLNTKLCQLDQLSFRAIGIGFPLLTIGILSGSVWANEAWGSYWSWDPKETWALITWMIFAIYLHLRLTKKWNGFKSALLGTIGFFVVWICFLGVNFLGKGLHSYGWFQ